MYRLFGRPKEAPAPAPAAAPAAAPAPAAPIDTAAFVRDMAARRDEYQARWATEHEHMFRLAKEMKQPGLPPFRKQQLLEEFKRCRFRKQGLEQSLQGLGDNLAGLERSEMAMQRGRDNLDMIKVKQQQLGLMQAQIAAQEKAGYGVDELEDLNDELAEVAATQAELERVLYRPSRQAARRDEADLNAELAMYDIDALPDPVAHYAPPAAAPAAAAPAGAYAQQGAGAGAYAQGVGAGAYAYPAAAAGGGGGGGGGAAQPAWAQPAVPSQPQALGRY
jgi:hypothetical protein